MKSIQTPNAPDAPFLSQGLISNGHIFLSGQIHVLSDNTLISGTVKEKVDQIIKNATEILVAANSSLQQVVKVIIYVTDMSIMAELNEAYTTYFKEPFPVREAVCVKALPLGADIEMSIVAEVAEI